MKVPLPICHTAVEHLRCDRAEAATARVVTLMNRLSPHSCAQGTETTVGAALTSYVKHASVNFSYYCRRISRRCRRDGQCSGAFVAFYRYSGTQRWHEDTYRGRDRYDDSSSAEQLLSIIFAHLISISLQRINMTAFYAGGKV